MLSTAAEVLEAVAASTDSSDAFAILNTVEAAHKSWPSAAPNADEDAAMANATSLAFRNALGLLATNATMEGVQRIAQATQRVVAGNSSGAALGGSRGLLNLADVLLEAVELNTAGPMGGLTLEPAKDALDSLASLSLRSIEIDEAGSDVDTRTLSQSLQRGIQALGEAVCNLAVVDEVSQVSSFGRTDSGITIRCKRTSIVRAASDGVDILGETVMTAGALVPPSSGAGRRLDTCDDIILQETMYHNMNIYFWATSGPFRVPSDAPLLGAGVQHCAATLGEQLPSGSHLRISVPLAGAPVSPDSSTPVCLRFDQASQGWTTDGVRSSTPPDMDGLRLECISSYGLGTYAAVFSDADQGSSVLTSPQPLLGNVTMSIIGASLVLAMSLCIGLCVWWRRGGMEQSDLLDLESQMSLDIQKSLAIEVRPVPPPKRVRFETTPGNMPFPEASTASDMSVSSEFEEEGLANPKQLKALRLQASPSNASPWGSSQGVGDQCLGGIEGLVACGVFISGDIGQTCSARSLDDAYDMELGGKSTDMAPDMLVDASVYESSMNPHGCTVVQIGDSDAQAVIKAAGQAESSWTVYRLSDGHVLV